MNQVKTPDPCGCSLGSERCLEGCPWSPSHCVAPVVLAAPVPSIRWMEGFHSEASSVQLWSVAVASRRSRHRVQYRMSTAPEALGPFLPLWWDSCSCFSPGNKPAKGSELPRCVLACEGTGGAEGVAVDSPVL